MNAIPEEGTYCRTGCTKQNSTMHSYCTILSAGLTLALPRLMIQCTNVVLSSVKLPLALG